MFAWFLSRPHWQRALLMVVLLGAVLHAGLTAARRGRKVGDFDVNREFGRRLLVGESLYHDGICFNYMPVSALYFAPLALVSPSVGTVLRYGVAVASLIATLAMLAAMTRRRFAAERWDGLAVAGIAGLLALHYLVRDLDDGGPHLILLAMLVAGIYFAWRGRQALAGVWFGLAIALKMTPALFLPFFLWKRQWRLAGWTLLASLVWIALPALWMGPAAWWQAQQTWNAVALNVLADRVDHARDANESKVQNQALKPALLRWMVAYPEGHPLKIDHPADVPFLRLHPMTANRIAWGAILALCAICAWASREPYRHPHDPAWLLECSGVLILVLLLSPLTWLQHVVFVLPALYLLVAEHRAGRALPPWAKVTLGAYVVIALVLNRELVGYRNYLLLLSFHSHTVGLLLLLWLLLKVRPTAALAPSSSPTPEPPPEPPRRIALEM